MPVLKFTKRDLLYCPFPQDGDLVREIYAILQNAQVSEDNVLVDGDDFARELRFHGYFERLWILCHGGDGSLRIGNTAGDSRISAADLAERLLELGLNTAVPEIMVWSCFGGKAGGFAQSLWLNLRRSLPHIRVSGLAGMTGSIAPGGAALKVTRMAGYFAGSGGDEGLHRMIDLSEIITYPGAPTVSFEV
ncbi:DUF4347 domain-containing protein [Algicella marina]|uniref:DUF4347 domain-containing protein n=1 Tax=Algicella marina TaxID=2683284 RepID=A0A6P1T0F3_9RHOB|nr:DUF4347 domain-containing protein [Algicella marina]QHQ36394.1 hypothetical protein GO499_15030 [Algicella marina]